MHPASHAITPYSVSIRSHLYYFVGTNVICLPLGITPRLQKRDLDISTFSSSMSSSQQLFHRLEHTVEGNARGLESLEVQVDPYASGGHRSTVDFKLKERERIRKRPEVDGLERGEQPSSMQECRKDSKSPPMDPRFSRVPSKCRRQSTTPIS